MSRSLKIKSIIASVVVLLYIVSTVIIHTAAPRSAPTVDTSSVASTIVNSQETKPELELMDGEPLYELEFEEEPEPAWRANLPVTQEFKDFVVWVSAYYGFEEKLIYQIMFCESSFDPRCDNGVCQGLMQVNKNYVDKYAAIGDEFCHLFSGKWDVYDPYINVVLGCRVLFDWKQMTEPMGYTDLTDWLAFYNRGWKYKEDHVTSYAEWVQNCDLASIDFSYLNGKVVG